MRIISADDLDRLMDFPGLVEALRAGFVAGAHVPARHHHAIGDGHAQVPIHLLMPAWSSAAPGPGTFIGTKIVNVFPGNGNRGLPSVLGTYLLQSGDTGEMLAVMDGTRLTHWRTAAASALAASHLARAEARHLLIVGAGALAPFLVRAHASVRHIRKVTLWNHRHAGAERLARSLQAAGFVARATEDLARAAAEADIISCATLASAPLVRGAWLRPGTHVDLVGAFTMAMREVDDEALTRARVFIDTPSALAEGGDVAAAIAAGTFSAGRVVADLAALCRGEARGRTAEEEITLFKSVGAALEDLAAATLVWSRVGPAA